MSNPGSKWLTPGLIVLTVALAILSCNNTSTPQNSVPATSTEEAPADSATGKLAKFDTTPITLDTAKRYIFLTFDDGPQPGTETCFDIFKKLGIKATFFAIAAHDVGAARKSIIDSIRDSYPNYLLANHSTTHAFSDHYINFYQHPHAAELDFANCQQKLDIPFKIVRLPGNSAWVTDSGVKASGLVRPVCKLLDSAGYNVIGWDEEWRFKTVRHESVPVQGAETMAKMINRDFEARALHTKNTLVLLAHDRMFFHPAYADSLYKCLAILKKDPRYVFETIDHYPGIKHSNN